MAARKQNWHTDDVRLKIKASQLVNRLQSHIFDNVEMQKTQVSAAIALLKKVVPDLQAVQLTGNEGGPIETKHTVTLDMARRVAFLLDKAGRQKGITGGSSGE